MHHINLLNEKLMHISCTSTGNRPMNNPFSVSQFKRGEQDFMFSGCIDAPSFIPAGSTGESQVYPDPYVTWATGVCR